MPKRSRFEKAQREAQSTRTKEIEAAWLGSLAEPAASAFQQAVAAARARPPRGPAPNMAPGTLPNPPKREPRPTKEERNRRPRS